MELGFEPGADNITEAGSKVLCAERIKEFVEAFGGIYLWQHEDPVVFYALLFLRFVVIVVYTTSSILAGVRMLANCQSGESYPGAM